MFHLGGPACQGYVIQASTNWLGNWLPIFTNRGTLAPLDFWDEPNQGRRFYQVVPWP